MHSGSPYIYMPHSQEQEFRNTLRTFSINVNFNSNMNESELCGNCLMDYSTVLLQQTTDYSTVAKPLLALISHCWYLQSRCSDKLVSDFYPWPSCICIYWNFPFKVQNLGRTVFKQILLDELLSFAQCTNYCAIIYSKKHKRSIP